MPAGTSEGVFTLPGGYADASGTVYREVELRSPTGREEECFSELDNDLCVAGFTGHVLSTCLTRIGSLTPVTPELAGEMLPRDQDFLIVRVYRRAFGPKLWIGLDCPAAACGRRMDIALMLDELPFEERPVDARYFREGDVEFRLPTGADLGRIALLDLPEEEARAHLLAMCLRHPEELAALDVTACEAIEARMQELAPPAEPEMDAVCPECGRPFTALLDLVPLLLSELRGNHHRLEREVHLLASHYHWAEREILSMPRRKRQRYVALVQEALESGAE
jgi:hypothetical protein